jgi:uncharacterized protein
VLLRWAPTISSDWLELNKAGYTLERYTLSRNSTRVFPSEVIKLRKSIRPDSLSDWEKISYDNDYAAIAAQAIYGGEFKLQAEQPSTDIINTIQLSKDQALRHSFVLLAADQSFEVAQMAGLGYEDLNIDENEAYMYKLYGNFSDFASDTAYTIVEMRNSAQLPKVNAVEAEFGDRRVTLRWQIDYYEQVYSSYIVEKSEDGELFQPLDDISNITTSNDKSKSLKWMLKSDSLITNEKKFYYRIRGKTPFGIVGPPSKLISGFGEDPFSLSIGIVDGEVKGNRIHLAWKVEGDSRKQVVQYLIHRSATSVEYSLLDSVPGTQYNFIDNEPLAANYYKIEAISKSGGGVLSLPYFLQAEDSIPPEVPRNLIGICDSTGRVNLSWSGNEEDDLKGYRVFRSRAPDLEYLQVTVEATPDSVYNDYVDLQTLSNKMYYKVLSVDIRGNRSSLSEPILVHLVDIIPPVPPRIIGYKSSKGTIEISWTNSSSKDGVSVRIFKSSTDGISMIEEISNYKELTSYVDSTVNRGLVSYFLTATDSSGNESKKSNIIQLKAPVSAQVTSFALSVVADRRNGLIELEWESEDDLSSVNGFRLYKAKNQEPISLYKVFTGDVYAFSDDLLEVNSSYQYRLQISYEDGTAVFSDQIKIVY